MYSMAGELVGDRDTLCNALAVWVVQVLDDLQTRLADHTTQPWPAENGSLPIPNGEAADGEVHAWFGARDNSVVRLDPLPVSAVLESCSAE